MLTTVEQVIEWFTAFGGSTNPYWVLYAGLDKREAGQRRAFNWETSDFEKAKKLLRDTLERYVITGGAYHLTVSDKPKDNGPAAGQPILLTPTGAANNTGAVAMVNGVAVPITNGYGGGGSNQNFEQIISLNNEKARLENQLEIQKLKSDFELEKVKAEQRINGIGSGVMGWLDSLSKHPSFDPNVPFNMINGIFGALMGGQQLANPQGLPEGIVNKGFVQQPPPPPPIQQQTETPQNTEGGVPFQYQLKDIGTDYHNFCELVGVPLENRQGEQSVLKGLMAKIAAMTPVEKMSFLSQFQ